MCFARAKVGTLRLTVCGMIQREGEGRRQLTWWQTGCCLLCWCAPAAPAECGRCSAAALPAASPLRRAGSAPPAAAAPFACFGDRMLIKPFLATPKHHSTLTEASGAWTVLLSKTLSGIPSRHGRKHNMCYRRKLLIGKDRQRKEYDTFETGTHRLRSACWAAVSAAATLA